MFVLCMYIGYTNETVCFQFQLPYHRMSIGERSVCMDNYTIISCIMAISDFQTIQNEPLYDIVVSKVPLLDHYFKDEMSGQQKKKKEANLNNLPDISRRMHSLFFIIMFMLLMIVIIVMVVACIHSRTKCIWNRTWLTLFVQLLSIVA